MGKNSKTSWFTDRSPLVKFLIGFAAIIGAITAINAGYEASGLPYPATRSFVELKFGPLKIAFDNTGKAVRDLQVESAEGKLAQTKDALAKWELELRKTNDPASRDLIQKQRRELEFTRDKLEQQLNTLRTMRSSDQ
jgi:hypothetical protein